MLEQHGSSEMFRAIHFGKDGAVLGISELCSSEWQRVAVPAHTLMADALRWSSHAVIVSHTRPDTPAPSRIDVEVTQRLAAALRVVGIRLHDHVVLAGCESVSFRRLGLL